MKFDALQEYVKDIPIFDIHLLTQISREPKRQLVTQLSYWGQHGKVMKLRRGLYTLADCYRKIPIAILLLANHIYNPSYVSGLWAMSYYDLIPEKVIPLTSVSTRVTHTFRNMFGTFRYFNVKKDFYWGFSKERIEGNEVWISEPEKAILDYFHLSAGEWTSERLEEMRFQNLEQLDFKKLLDYAKRWSSPRLLRAVEKMHNLFVDKEQ